MAVQDTTIVGEDQPTRPSSTPTPIERGTEVGRYVVLDQLGRGGMGVVYAAYDPQLDRKVALKLLHAQPGGGLDTSDGRPRLLREAQALAKLQHSNVIAVHDVGTVAGAVFIAMEFIEGQTLGEWTEAAPSRPRRDVIAMFVAAGRGLAAAHRAGIVHRDFKPDNVMIGKDGRPRVLDFGLARAADLAGASGTSGRASLDALLDVLSSNSFEAKLTVTGTVMGTPAYMAPEQHFGRAVDERSDQFSFCVAVYEALYGERPFAGDTLAALAFSVTSGTVREPTAASAVPNWLRKVVLRGLAVNPAQRYPSMDELLRALDRDPTRMRRGVLLGVGLLAALVGVALLGRALVAEPKLCTGAEQHLVGIWDPATRTSVHEAFTATGAVYAEAAFHGFAATLDDYTGQWTAMHGEACTATRIRGEQSDELLTLRMACLDRSRNQISALVEVYRDADAKTIERAVEAAESLPPLRLCADTEALTLGIRPPETAALADQVEALRGKIDVARTLGQAGRQVAAREQLAAVMTEVDATGYRPLIAEAELARGLALEVVDQQVVALERAVWMAEVSRHDRVVAEAWIKLISVYGTGINDYERAFDAVERAEAAIERIGGDPELRIRLDNSHGGVLSSMGQFEPALVLLRRARAARVAAGQGGSPIALNELVALTNALTSDSQEREARDLLDEALTLAEPSLGSDHPWVARLRATLGRAQYRLGDYAEGEASIRSALTVFERANGKDSPQVGGVLNGLAVILDEQRRFDEAQIAYRRGIEIYRRNNGPRHYNVGIGLLNLGLLEIEVGQFEAGIADLEEALSIKLEVRGPNSPTVGSARNALGDALVTLGRYEQAAIHYRAVIDTIAGTEHSTIVDAMTGLALVELGLGHPAEARRILELTEPRFEAVNTTTAGGQAFALAKLVWDDGEHERALRLAERALGRYTATTVYYQPERDEVAAWLAKHRPAP